MCATTLKRNLAGDFEISENGKTRNLGNLDAASARGSAQDVANVNYAKSKYGYTPPAPAGAGLGNNAGASALPTTPSMTNPMEASDNPADIFNLLMVDSLKKAQGVNTADLYKRKRELERAALGGQQEITPEALRTLSPAQQAAIRSGKVAPLQPEFDEIAYEIKKAENAISNYQNVFQNVMKINADFAEKMVAPDSIIANYKKAVELDPEKLNGLLSEMNDATKKKFLDSLDWEKMKPKDPLSEYEAKLKLDQKYKDTTPSVSEQLAAAEGGYDINDGKIVKSDGTYDPITGTKTDTSKVIKVGNQSYNFTSYATDPNWGNAINDILTSLPDFTTSQEVNNYIQSQAPGSILKAEDIEAVALQEGISPELLLSIAAHESAWGTSNVAKQNNNFSGNSNVGERGTARPTSEGGYYTKFASPADSLRALAKNILKREIDQSSISQPESEADKIAQDIFSGVSNLKLSDISTAKNLRGKVSEKLTALKKEAIAKGDMAGILSSSAGGATVSDTFSQSFSKAMGTMGQLDELYNAFDNEKASKQYSKDTGIDLNPVFGQIRKFNPWDTNAQQIKATLQATVPQLARGIYGEVGVLTDNDIKLYQQTLPTLTSTEDVRRVVLGATLRSVQRAMENQLKVQAASGKDVSGFTDIYNDVKSKADELLTGLDENKSEPNAFTSSSGNKYNLPY